MKTRPNLRPSLRTRRRNCRRLKQLRVELAHERNVIVRNDRHQKLVAELETCRALNGELRKSIVELQTHLRRAESLPSAASGTGRVIPLIYWENGALLDLLHRLEEIRQSSLMGPFNSMTDDQGRHKQLPKPYPAELLTHVVQECAGRGVISRVGVAGTSLALAGSAETEK